MTTVVHTVKSKMKISQNFVDFSEYMNFNALLYDAAYKIMYIHIKKKLVFLKIDWNELILRWKIELITSFLVNLWSAKASAYFKIMVTKTTKTSALCSIHYIAPSAYGLLLCI